MGSISGAASQGAGGVGSQTKTGSVSGSASQGAASIASGVQKSGGSTGSAPASNPSTGKVSGAASQGAGAADKSPGQGDGNKSSSGSISSAGSVAQGANSALASVAGGGGNSATPNEGLNSFLANYYGITAPAASAPGNESIADFLKNFYASSTSPAAVSAGDSDWFNGKPSAIQSSPVDWGDFYNSVLGTETDAAHAPGSLAINAALAGGAGASIKPVDYWTSFYADTAPSRTLVGAAADWNAMQHPNAVSITVNGGVTKKIGDPFDAPAPLTAGIPARTISQSDLIASDQADRLRAGALSVDVDTSRTSLADFMAAFNPSNNNSTPAAPVPYSTDAAIDPTQVDEGNPSSWWGTPAPGYAMGGSPSTSLSSSGTLVGNIFSWLFPNSSGVLAQTPVDAAFAEAAANNTPSTKDSNPATSISDIGSSAGSGGGLQLPDFSGGSLPGITHGLIGGTAQGGSFWDSISELFAPGNGDAIAPFDLSGLGGSNGPAGAGNGANGTGRVGGSFGASGGNGLAILAGLVAVGGVAWFGRKHIKALFHHG